LRKAALFSFLLLLILPVVGGCTFRSHVIDVTLVNNGRQEARNIEFRYPGGSFGVASLAPGQTYQYKIKPFYNGSVEIEFLYGVARVRSTISKVEKDQAGKARVIFDETGVKWDGFRLK
jgi:hypothetical protein